MCVCVGGGGGGVANLAKFGVQYSQHTRPVFVHVYSIIRFCRTDTSGHMDDGVF